CCHSQSLQLTRRPMVPFARAPSRLSDHKAAPAPAPAPAPKPKAAKKAAPKEDGLVCFRKCQNLCNPHCKFECCLPTHRHFDDDPKPVQHHYKPKVDKKKELLKKKLRDSKYIHPIVGPEAVRFPRIRLRPTSADADPCQGQDPNPCVNPTTSPFEGMTDPFGSSTQGYGMTQNPYVTQSYAPQIPPDSCAAPCPQSCAPSCDTSCCAPQPPQMPLPPPMPLPLPLPMPLPMPNLVAPGPAGPMYAVSPGLSPIGQAPTCSAGCSNVCAPSCSQMCCQEFPQVVHVPPATAVAPQKPGSPGLTPMGRAPATCPGACPNLCVPSCDFHCCAGPQVVHVPSAPPPVPAPPPVQASLQVAAPAAPALIGSPGLHPIGTASTCPGSCPNICAPSCSSTCCAVPQTCPSPTCPDSCAPSCSATCCSHDDLLPANWDRRRSYINGLWRRYGQG
ncbi:hypothetical protein QZH41_019599, partial [Actinostola sp. cb2023]